MLSIPVFGELSSLDGSVKDYDTLAELKAGYGYRYELRKPRSLHPITNIYYL